MGSVFIRESDTTDHRGHMLACTSTNIVFEKLQLWATCCRVRVAAASTKIYSHGSRENRRRHIRLILRYANHTLTQRTYETDGENGYGTNERGHRFCRLRLLIALPGPTSRRDLCRFRAGRGSCRSGSGHKSHHTPRHTLTQASSSGTTSVWSRRAHGSECIFGFCRSILLWRDIKPY